MLIDEGQPIDIKAIEQLQLREMEDFYDYINLF